MASLRRLAYANSYVGPWRDAVVWLRPSPRRIAAKVESFSPQGQIKDVRQVVARFSQPMVSFGDPRSEAPFDIDE